ATRLDSLARFRESDRVTPVQEQNRILCSKLLCNGTADSAAGACNEVTLHCSRRKRRTSNPPTQGYGVASAQRPTPNWRLAGRERTRRAFQPTTRRSVPTNLRPAQRKSVIRCLPQAQSNK